MPRRRPSSWPISSASSSRFRTLHALSQDTDAQLRSLNALAEHVSAKVKALESQQSVVEHALVESRRVHEMVWEMEVQLNKLNEGSKRATRVEETLAKLERIQAETDSAARGGRARPRDVRPRGGSAGAASAQA